MTNPRSTSTSSPGKATSPDEPEAAATPAAPYRLNRLRYLRIVVFFGGLFARALWWYLLLPRLLPFTRGLVRSGASARLRRWARQFRDLAVQMGGVMIKLGQFVSSRVDVLPPEITEELAGLQDEVPTVPFEVIARTLREDLGANWRARFAWLEERPVAAASLGQAHRAQLPDGERVVIKVQRPGIESIVYTDLSALDVVVRLAMRFRFISRRVNLPLLLEEFARVLWEELDYIHEADNTDRFAEIFADDLGVYIPVVYRAHTTRRVLTLEDVTAIKLNDYAALEAAGIDRRAVAQRLLDTYLEQIFIHHFFHADPHPGNIFIYPLPPNVNGSLRRPRGQQPFYLVFVDFGMTGQLTPRIAEGLRETLIAVITRDERRLVQSYHRMGVLLPGADVRRIEEASRAVFDRVWGLNMTELAQVDYGVMRDMARDFSDLLYALPFQLPQDFVYLGRAVGILSGMCTGLDPQFDPWQAIQPFVQRLLIEDSMDAVQRGWEQLFSLENLRALLTLQTMNIALSEGRNWLTRAITLPVQAERVLTQAERGELELRARPSEELDRHLSRIERSGNQLVIGLIFASIALSSTVLYVNNERTLGMIGFVIAFFTLIVLLTRRG